MNILRQFKKKNTASREDQNKNDLRKTYLKILGDVPWGTHLCQFYKTKEDLTDILVPYFRAGLENNEYCMWITAEPLHVEDALKALAEAVPDFRKYLMRGQIEILPYDKWYVKEGSFSMQRVMNAWLERLDGALKAGYDGIRVTGNTAWLEKADWKSFAEYEEALNGVIGNYRVLAICTYSLDRCGASEIIDVVNNHKFAIVRKEGRWELFESADRKLIELKLMEAERKYRTLFEQSPEGVVLIDPETKKHLEFNDTAYRQLGYSREEFEKMSISDYECMESPVDTEKRIKAIMETGKEDFETLHRAKNGGIRNVLVTVQKINLSGHPVFHCIFRDITKMRRAENELREREERFRNIFNESPIGIEIYDNEGRLLNANGACLEMFGIKDISEVRDFSLFDDPNLPEDVKERIRSGEIVRYEAVFDFEKIRKDSYRTRKKGSIYLDVLITPLKKWNGSGGGYMVQVQDITKRRLAEKALLVKSEAALTEAQRIAHVGNWEWDIASDKVFWSDELYNIYGFKRGKPGLTIRSVFPCNHLEDIEAIDKAVLESLEEGKPLDIEHRVILPDGGIKCLHSIGEVSFDQEGNPSRFFGTSQDITESKKAAEELKRLFAELERSNKDLEEFAYIVSHDLQEPLRMVSGFLNLINKRYEGLLDDEGKKFIDFAVSGTGRMSTMISDLLTYSRVSTRTKVFEKVSCEEILARTLEDLRSAISNNEAQITHGPLPDVVADHSQLGHVFQNLIENAIKFRKHDEPPRIHISSKKIGKEWVFSVADNGIGIDPAYRDKIFQVFHRLHGKEYSGTGIGLAVCKKVVERHGGRIWVDSKPGYGSTFNFTIPVKGGNKENQLL